MPLVTRPRPHQLFRILLSHFLNQFLVFFFEQEHLLAQVLLLLEVDQRPILHSQRCQTSFPHGFILHFIRSQPHLQQRLDCFWRGRFMHHQVFVRNLHRGVPESTVRLLPIPTYLLEALAANPQLLTSNFTLHPIPLQLD